VKKAGKDKAVQFDNQIDPHTRRGNSNDNYYCAKQRSHHEAHYFHYSWCRDCYVPGTCHWLPPALVVEENVRSIRRKVPSRKEACNEVRTVRWIDGA
jgi:hypothetical protein